jgi:transcriptional regulator with XRE-family HTH domain
MSKLRYGKTARSRREQLGISREKLAYRASVSTSTIVRLENEDRLPNALILAAIAAELDVTSSYLLGEEQPKDTSNDARPAAEAAN